jgi:GTP cyclohydrolase I
MDILNPQGAACVIEAKHFCMTSRGVGKQNSVMVTSSLKGCFLGHPETRQELMKLIN